MLVLGRYKVSAGTHANLLEIDKSFTIPQRNIQTLAIEIFKAFNNIGPAIVRDIFVVRIHNGPSLRNPTDFVVPMIKTVTFGEDSLRYFGSKIWELIPQEIKNVQNIATFKNSIRKWIPNKCPCRLCKTYIQGGGLY